MTDAQSQDAPAPAVDEDAENDVRRDALIAAALALLDRGGLIAFSLRGVCTEARENHTAPRDLFGDFSGLRAAVAALGFGRLGVAVAAALATAGPARADAADAAIHAYVRFAAESPALYQLMFEIGLLQDRHGPTAQAARAALGPFFAVAKGLELTLRAEPMEGGLSEGYYLWSLAHGHAQLAATGAYGLMPPLGASGEVIAPDTARAAPKAGVEDAVEHVVAGPSAPPSEAPDFRRIVPRLRFAQPFKFEALEAGPNAQMLSAPTERGARSAGPERAVRAAPIMRPPLI